MRGAVIYFRSRSLGLNLCDNGVDFGQKGRPHIRQLLTGFSETRLAVPGYAEYQRMSREVLCGVKDKVWRDRGFIRIESFTEIRHPSLLVAQHWSLAQSGIGVAGLYAERDTNRVVD